ncbi:helix-turn-helix transcriptional regulator [Cohnella soli]|uniref:Helix-turn-helix domain-containing protein n=1 Tax=Cohnella soli TaxID=425005 RepID=A0ABW0I1A4_9BACL
MHIRSFIGTHEKEWEDPHAFRHESLELTNIVEGSGLFRWGEKEIPVSAGHIVLIPPDVAHSFHAVTAIRFAVILMDGLPQATRELFDRLLLNGEPTVIALSPFDQEQYAQLFKQWLRIASSKLKDPERSYEAWLDMLLLFVSEHSQAGTQAQSVAHIADYIRTNLDIGLQIGDLAEKAGLSEEGFRKRFMKAYGMTPKQYHQMCKMTEAKWLLSSSDKDMQAIAEAIGFGQLHSFSTWFKQLEGCSPSEWRKAQRLYHH